MDNNNSWCAWKKIAIRRLGLSRLECLVVVGILLSLIALSMVASNLLRQRFEKSVADSLTAVSDATISAIFLWRGRQVDLTKNLVQSKELVTIVQSLLADRPGEPRLHSEASEFFAHLLMEKRYTGFSIIAPDNTTLTSSEPKQRGLLHPLVSQPEILARLWSGTNAVSRVLHKESQNTGGELAAAEKPVIIYVGHPVTDQRGEIIALLAMEIDPFLEVFPLFQQGRVGQTGETYAVDGSGLLLSESRFLEALASRKPNMVGGGHTPDQAHWLPDIATNIIRQQSGQNFTGYNGYLGTPVVGVWKWYPSANVGIVTEQSVSEAYSSFYFVQRVMFAGAFFLGLLFIALIIFFVRGRKTERRDQLYLDAIYNNSSDAMLVIDELGTIERCNSTTATIFGYRSEEVIGNKVKMLMPESYRQHHDGYLEHFRQGSPRPGVTGARREVVGQRKGGSTFEMEFLVTPLKIEGRLVALGVVTDISARRDAEQRAEHFEQRLETTLSLVKFGVWHWNIIEDEVTWTPGTATICGHDEQSHQPVSMEACLANIYPDDQEVVEKNTEACFKEGKFFNQEYRVVDPDGSVRWVEDQGYVIRDESGRPVELVGVIRDVTESHRVQQQLLEQKQALEANNQVLEALRQEAVENMLEAEAQREISQQAFLDLTNSQRALKESEYYLHSLLDACPAQIFTLSRDLKYTFVNKSWLLAEGTTLDQVIGKTEEEVFQDLEETTRGDAALDDPDFRKVLSNKLVIQQEETFFHGTEEENLLTTLFPIMDAGGEAIAVGGWSLEITSMVQANRELEQSRGALKESEHYLQSLLDACPAQIFTFDRDLKYTFVNEAWKVSVGEVAEEALGKNMAEVLEHFGTISFGESVLEEGDFRRVLTGKQVIQQEETFFNNNVEENILTTLFPIVGAGGEAIAVGGWSLDVTNMVQAKRELEQSKAALEKNQLHLSAMFSTAPVYIFTKDKDLRYNFVNDAWLSITGLGHSDVIGKDEFGIFDDTKAARRSLEVDRKVLATGEIQTNEETHIVNGQEVHLVSHIVPLKDGAGNIYGVSGWSENVTHYKEINRELEQSRAALKDSEYYLQSLLDACPAQIYTRDTEMKYTFVNEAWKTSTGEGAEEVIGKTEAEVSEFFGIIVEGESMLDDDDFRKVLTGKLVIQQEETYFHDTVEENVLSTLFPIMDSGGEVISVGGWSIDITDMVLANRELEQARLDAEASNQAKSAFLATMSHEIRTPMNGVVGMLDVLRLSKLDDSQLQLADGINESAFSLLRIIDDILDFSKIESGKLDMESIPVSLEPLLANVAATLLPNARNRGVELLLWCDSELPEIIGDPVRIRQIITNLAGNAIKFTETSEEQPGRVIIRCSSDTRLPGAGDSGGQLLLRLSVEDNGIGIEPGAQRRLFQPFVQAEGSTTRQFGGSGLGLSITARLVEMMDGEIELHTEPGLGSTFSVAIPFEAVAETEKADPFAVLAEIPVYFVTGGDVIDDIVLGYLRSAGISCFEASRGQAEHVDWLLAAQEELVVIIVDNRMNDLGVLLAKQQIEQQLNEVAKLNFIILSRGYRMEPRQLDERTLQLDFNGLDRIRFLRTLGEITGRVSEQPYETDPEFLLESVALSMAAAASGNQRRLLVAEDNSLNQKVITHQAGILGYAVDMADDGEAALAMWQQNRDRYQLLLTDCHMPKMDGYGLAAAIREQEGADQRLPIIALTADALKGTREKCLAAGMDDYLSKPLLIETLHEKLTAWVLSPGAAAEEGAQPQAAGAKSVQVDDIPVEAESCPVDSAVLAKLLGTEDPAMLEEFYQEYRRSAVETVKEICAALEAGNHSEMGSLGHKLKSSSYSVGANNLGDLCLSLEVSGKSGDDRKLTEHVEQLQCSYGQVESWIDRNFPGL